MILWMTDTDKCPQLLEMADNWKKPQHWYLWPDNNRVKFNNQHVYSTNTCFSNADVKIDMASTTSALEINAPNTIRRAINDLY